MEFFDLTLPLVSGMPVAAGDPPVQITRVRTHQADGYEVTRVCLGSHSGTHVDVPRHFFADGPTLDRYPLERLIAPGILVDCRPIGTMAGETAEARGMAETASARGMGETASARGMAETAKARGMGETEATTGLISADLLAARLGSLAARGDCATTDLGALVVPRGGFVLLRTGESLLSPEAARLLLDTGAGAVGTDASGLDEEPYPVHRLLLRAGVLLIENLAGLDRIEPGPLMCACLPLALAGTDGAPVRMVAWR